MSWTSFHRDLWVRRSISDWKSPGGKGAPGRDERFDQGGYEEFAVQPCSGRSGVEFLQIPHAKDRLEPLERQFHLPSSPENFKDRLRGKGVIEGGKDDHILSRFEGFGLDVPSFFAVFLKTSGPCGFARSQAFANRADPTGNPNALVLEPDVPITHLPVPQPPYVRQDVKATPPTIS